MYNKRHPNRPSSSYPVPLFKNQFPTKTRFDTEVKANWEKAYLLYFDLVIRSRKSWFKV